MKMQADRASGAWFQTILESFKVLHDMEAIDRMSVSVFSAPSDDEAKLATVFAKDDCQDVPQWFQDERNTLDSLFCLLTEVAADRAWNQMFFVTSVPQAFASIASSEHDAANTRLQYIKLMFQAVFKAEAVEKQPMKKLISRMLSEVGWNRMQLARELYLVANDCDWKVENGGDLRKLVERMFSSPPTTKFDLEDVFAHLVSVCRLSSLSNPMNKQLDEHYSVIFEAKVKLGLTP